MVPIIVALVVVGGAGFVAANLNPPGPPDDPSSQSYTLRDICNRLESGTPGVMAETFTEPTSKPGETEPMCNLNELFSLLPEPKENCATTAEAEPGKSFWGVCEGSWGLQGEGGSSAPAPLPATGQTTSYAGRDDGALQLGESTSPRFTDNSDGTVTDNLTGLTWLKNANCSANLGGVNKYTTINWANAITWSGALGNGSCGLSDGSSSGDWRLPNVRELRSIIDHGATSAPRLPTGHPFTGVVSNYYWSSSTYAPSTSNAWFVNFNYGSTNGGGKASINYVWPVR